MPRPYVDRVALSVRLPRSTYDRLRAQAVAGGLSVNAALIDAAEVWLAAPETAEVMAMSRAARNYRAPVDIGSEAEDLKGKP